MKQRITILTAALAALALAVPAVAQAAPELELEVERVPAAGVPVPAGTYTVYDITLLNPGDEETTSNTPIEFSVPPGLEIVEVKDLGAEELAPLVGEFLPIWECTIAPDKLSVACDGPEIIGEMLPTFPGGEACLDAFELFFSLSLSCPLQIVVEGTTPTEGPVSATITACGGGASACPTPAFTAPPDPFEVVPYEWSLASFDGEVLQESGDPETQAGSHPHTAATDFHVNTFIAGNGWEYPTDTLKDAAVELPPGIVGNPQVVDTCSQVQLAAGATSQVNCPNESQVGRVTIYFNGGQGSPGDPSLATVPVYNMEVPFGLPALFGFKYSGNVTMVYGEVRTGEDYGVTAAARNAPETFPIEGVDFEFWGVPADPVHDPERHCAGGHETSSGCESADSADPKAFVSLPTSCVGPVETFIDVTGWHLGDTASSSFLSHDNTEPDPVPIGADGCNAVPFAPTLQARPTTTRADAPSGLDVNLHIPQSDDPEGIATAHLKDTTVTLPEGLVLNPSGANGLDGCSESEIDLDGAERGDCPDASRIADVQVETPLLANPMPGSVYLADPHDNPFNSLLALYIEVDDKKTGIVVKLPGEVSLDSDGQISATFEDNPQLPFEDFDLEFFGGAGGALRTPAVCGDYETESKLTPWTAPEGQPVNDTDTWAIQSGCADSEGALPHAPSFDAGTVSPLAGADSPFVMHLRREDGSQNISAVNVSPPPGLLAKLAGTAICPEPLLARAESRDGEDEQDSPSCPATSRLGSVVAGAGAGPAPYYAQGTAYLAGPYRGAPVSIAVLTPAVAGPFDLGTILTRIAAHVDPQTARITAVSDPLPEMLEGIPLDIRTVDVAFDKPGFTRNPTSCDPLAVDGLVVSTLGALAPVSSRFQVGECGRLGFKPQVFLRLFGKRFTRGSNPRLRAIVMPREGDANIARTAVTMPRSLFLDQSHIRTICTRIQFAANACPAGSIYGSATAFSPLVDYPLSGNVYLRSSDNKLPDLVADLRGPAHQPVRVEVSGRTDSVKGALRNTFDVVPDAPVSKFVLHLQAGRKSLLVASRNLCKGAQRAKINMSAQNGRQLLLQPKIRIPCGKQRKGKGKRRNRAALSRAQARP